MTINSSVGILGSVGRNGRNDKLDVVAIQTRLNELMGQSREHLVPDGICGPLTRGMIGDFQINVAGFRWPDYRVDPAGKTIVALNDPGSASIWQRMSIPLPPDPADPRPSPKPTPKDPPPAKKPSATPRALTPEEIAATKPGGFLRFVDSAAPGGVTTILPGEVWVGPEGNRLIIHALEWTAKAEDGTEKPEGVITFLQLSSDIASQKAGTVYRQSREGFLIDMLYAGIAIAGKRLESTQTLIEAEMQFLMGVASISGVVALADTGLKATEWVFFNHRNGNLKKWSEAVSLILDARSTLKTYAPTLWDKIIDAALLGAWKGAKVMVAMFGTDIAGNIPAGMISDKKKLGKASGMLLGKLGAGDFKGRLGALKAIWTILLEVTKHAVKSVPAAMKITYAQKKKAATDIVAALHRSGVALSDGDALAVVEEIAANADEVVGALGKLKDGFAALK